MENGNDLPRLAAPARRALAGKGISTLEQLSLFAEREVSALHGMGPNAISKLRQAMSAKGLKFTDARPGRGSK